MSHTMAEYRCTKYLIEDHAKERCSKCNGEKRRFETDAVQPIPSNQIRGGAAVIFRSMVQCFYCRGTGVEPLPQ